MITEEDFNIPEYELNFDRPVVGVGNFTTLATAKQFCTDVLSQDYPSRIDRSIVKKKIALWRKVIKSGILGELSNPQNPLLIPNQTNNEYLRLKSLSLLNDKTIAAYHHFRFDNQPLELRYFQDILLSDKGKRILFTASNQLGKSLGLDTDAGIEFITDHKKEWIGIFVSKSLPQSQYQMSRVKQLLRSAEIEVNVEETEETKTGKKDNSYEITYTFYDERGKPKYTNRLICCPPTGSALGYPADVMWLDEFDFWENINHDNFIKQVAIPRTFETKGAIKVFTNPNGKRALWKLWTSTDKKGKPVWHRYTFNYWDTPNASQEDFDYKSVGMTRSQIDSTLLAIFSSAGGAVFSNEEIEDMKDTELEQKGDLSGIGKETAWFLDVGSVHDQSVLAGGYVEPNPDIPELPLINIFYIHKYPVGYPLGRVVGIEIKEKDGWEDYAQDNPSVKETLTQYSTSEEEQQEKEKKILEQPLFAYDITGNSGMLPLFQAVNIDAIDVTFSGKRKWQMYQRAQYYAQQRLLKKNPDRDQNTVNGKDGNYQLSRLVITKDTEGGRQTNYRKVHHESEEDYDDVPDAIVGLIYIIENPDISTLQFDIINNKGSIYKDNDKEEEDPNETERQKMERLQKDQYIPKFMREAQGFDNYIEQKMSQRY